MGDEWDIFWIKLNRLEREEEGDEADDYERRYIDIIDGEWKTF